MREVIPGLVWIGNAEDAQDVILSGQAAVFLPLRTEETLAHPLVVYRFI